MKTVAGTTVVAAHGAGLASASPPGPNIAPEGCGDVGAIASNSLSLFAATNCHLYTWGLGSGLSRPGLAGGGRDHDRLVGRDRGADGVLDAERLLQEAQPGHVGGGPGSIWTKRGVTALASWARWTSGDNFGSRPSGTATKRISPTRAGSVTIPRPLGCEDVCGVVSATGRLAWPGLMAYSIGVIQNADYLTPKQKRDILYNNAARFLRLDAAR